MCNTSVQTDLNMIVTVIVPIITVVISAFVSFLVSSYTQRQSYKLDYYKSIVSKRMEAYQFIETQLKVMKASVADSDVKGVYHQIFMNTQESFMKFQQNLNMALLNSLWISAPCVAALEELNTLFYNASNEMTDDKKHNAKIGVKYYNDFARCRIKVENCLKTDLSNLHDVESFLKTMTISKGRKIFIPTK